MPELARSIESIETPADIIALPFAPEVNPRLDQTARNILLLSSLGGNILSMASILKQEAGDIETTQRLIVEQFQAPNMAAAVNHAILKRILTLKYDRKPQTNLSPRDFMTLQVFAAGGENRAISELAGEKSRNKVVTWNKRLFNKIGARGRVHSVRRAYEIHAFNRNHHPITLEELLRH